MKKAYVWAVPLALLLAVALLKWEPAVYYVLGRAVRHYGARSHIDISFSAISGNPLSTTTLAGVALAPEEGRPQAFRFKAQAVSCSYNLWNLKQGVDVFLRGLSCRVESPEFLQDLTVGMGEEETGAEAETFLLPAALPELVLQNGSVRFVGSGWDAELITVNGRLHSAVPGHELQLDAGLFRLAKAGATRLETDMASRIRYRDTTLSIDSFELGRLGVTASGWIVFPGAGEEGYRFGADIDSGENRLTLEGSLEEQLLSLHLGTDALDVNELRQRFAFAADLAGRITGEAQLAYDLGAGALVSGTFGLAVEKGRFRTIEVEIPSFSGILDREVLTLNSVEAAIPGSRVQVSDITLSLPLLQAGSFMPLAAASHGKFSLEISDAGPILQLLALEDEGIASLAATAAVRLEGHLEDNIFFFDRGSAAAGKNRFLLDQGRIPVPDNFKALKGVPLALSGRFESKSLAELFEQVAGIPLKGETVVGLEISGTVSSPRASVDLVAENLEYGERQLGSLELQGEVKASLDKAGRLEAAHFSVTRLRQANGSGILGLAGPAAGSWQQGSLSLDAALQADGEADISLALTKGPVEGIALKLTTRNLGSKGWLGSFVDPRYFFQGSDLEADLSVLPGKRPQLFLQGTVAQAGGSGVPFPLAGRISLAYSAEGIEISEFAWKSPERNSLTVTGFLPYDPLAGEPLLGGALSLAAHAEFPSLEDVAAFLEQWGIARGSATLDLEMAGSWDNPRGNILLRADDLQPLGMLQQLGNAPIDLAADLTLQHDALFLETARLDSELYTAEAQGSWQHGFSLRDLLLGKAKELRGEVSADAVVRLKDLNFLREKISGLRRVEGYAEAKVNLFGPVTRPNVKGTISFREGELAHTFNFPVLKAVNLEGVFNENSITIATMDAEIGGAPVSLEGKIDRSGKTVVLGFRVEGKNVLLFRNSDMSMRGDVKLDVEGPLERLVIRGTTAITGGYYTRDVDFLGMIGSRSRPVTEGTGFLFSFSEPLFKDVVFDVGITSSKPFRIRNNLVRGAVRPDLSLRGTGELPFLVGTVYIDPSRVVLPSGRLQVQSGLIRFPEKEPDRPQLDLLAHSKILGYDINLVTSGPLDDPVITLSSSPALPNDELLLLLLTGQPPKTGTSGASRGRGATNVMVYLGRDFLERWLADDSAGSDESVLDRFELDFGRNITRSGEQTVEATFRLGGQAAATGKTYYLSAEKDRYDAYNYGLKLVFRFE